MIKAYSYKKDSKKIVCGTHTVAEFACKDRAFDEVLIDDALFPKILEMERHFGKPMKITSGYRPRPYNVRIGGARNSQHIFGRAIDYQMVGVPKLTLCQFAEKLGMGGIGYYGENESAHMDTRSDKARWHQRSPGAAYTTVAGFGGVDVTLRLGDVGIPVQELCRLLRLPIYDRFSKVVQTTVVSYQMTHNLTGDGVVGPKTWKSLRGGR